MAGFRIVDGVPVADPAPPLRLRVAHVGQANTVLTASDGDLWPSAWADDGALYTAAGDGTGFSRHGWSDIVVNRIDGLPETGLTGERLSDGDAVAPVWQPEAFNRKPTGMVAVDGNGDGRDELYLAVQDLRIPNGPGGFDEAPTATIVRSDDYGRTWTWPERPLFTDHVFTTVMFLDLGRSNGGGPWVYAYGIDGNWRTSFAKLVEDPTRLFLARVPAASVQDRATWEFVSGFQPDGRPVWSRDIALRAPVLIDERRFYPTPAFGNGAHDFTCIAQGSVVWNPGLGRYLYSTWSEYTFEFFEAPAPWGPWRHLHSHDFGHFPWHGPRSPLAKHGGYAPTIPSKFLSADGRDLWLQSNWFVPASSRGGRAYCFGLRHVRFDPGDGAVTAASGNLALAPDAFPLVSRVREGQESVLNDGRRDHAEDSAFGPGAGEDVWGYEWPSPRVFDRVVYAPGPQDSLGGWFADGPRVEARVDGAWMPVPGVTVTPPYRNDFTALEEDEYVFEFAPVTADGVRLVGTAGGPLRYTSIAELEVWTPVHDRAAAVVVSSADETSIVELADAFSSWPKPRDTFHTYARRHAVGEIELLVARADSAIAGYCLIEWKSSYPPFAAAGIPEIVDLNVLPTARGRGVGTMLLEAAEGRAARRSRSVGLRVGLYEDYGAAQRLYVRRGYVPDGHGVTVDGVVVPPGSTIVLDDEPTLALTLTLPAPSGG